MKKTSGSLIFNFFTALFFMIFFSGFIFAVYGRISKNIKSSFSDKEFTVIIDPGHGGEDGGAVGIGGIYEKNINLSISKKLESFLNIAGYKVIMTRNEDKAVYEGNPKTLRNKKRSDLKYRLKIMNENSSQSTIFVSIHQNKFQESQYYGSQIFYSKNNPLSEDLALDIRNAIKGLIQPENEREIKPAGSNIFLLHNAKIPAVVVECGFISNSEDSKKLINEDYQGKVAFSIFCGIVNYFTKR